MHERARFPNTRLFAYIKNALKATESAGDYVPAALATEIEQSLKNSAGTLVRR